MLGFFGKTTDPLWSKIELLQVEERWDICLVLGTCGFVREMTGQRLIGQLEEVLGLPAIRRICSSGIPSLPFSASLRTRLVDQALIASLRCTPPDRLPAGVLRFLTPEQFIDMLGFVSLEAINARDNRPGPCTLAETGFTSDPDEARTQLLMRVIKILGIDSPSMVAVLSETGFAPAWSDLVSSCVRGVLVGASRIEPESTFAKGKELCRSLPPRVRGILDHWADRGLARQRRILALERMDKDALAKAVLGDPSALVRRTALNRMGWEVDTNLRQLEADIRCGGHSDIRYLGRIATLGWFCRPMLDRLSRDPNPQVGMLARDLLNHATQSFWQPPCDPPTEP